VGDEQDRPALGGGAPQEVVEEVAPGGVEPGVGFVEEQEPRAAGQRDRQARPPLLAGREAPEGHPGQAGEAELLEDGVGVGHPTPSGPDPEAHVLPDGQVVVGAGGMADKGQLRADGVAVGGEVVTKDDGRAGRQGEEAGQQPQQRRLAGAVGPRHQDHLALDDVEIDPGQRRILAEEAHGGPQMDGGTAQINSNCSD
jgi:hypothetical protein